MEALNKVLIQFTHATKNTEVFVPAPIIFSVYSDVKLGGTMLLSSGGALMPVKESVEEAASKLEKYYRPTPASVAGVITTTNNSTGVQTNG